MDLGVVLFVVVVAALPLLAWQLYRAIQDTPSQAAATTEDAPAPGTLSRRAQRRLAAVDAEIGRLEEQLERARMEAASSGDRRWLGTIDDLREQLTQAAERRATVLAEAGHSPQ